MQEQLLEQNLEQDLEQYLDSISNFDQLLQTSKAENSSPMIKGVITKLDQKQVIVDVKRKEQGVIPRSEFNESDGRSTLKIGDEVVVYRTVSSDGNSTHFSRARARLELAWSDIEQAFRDKQNLEAVVTEYVKGGYKVEILNAPAFLPSKQLEAVVNDPKSILNHKIKVKIIKPDRARGIVTVSQKYAEHSSDSIHAIIKSVEKDHAILTANEREYTLLAHDYLWETTTNLCEKLKADQLLRVRIVDEKDGVTYVSHKVLFSDPWFDSIKQAGLVVGTSLMGRVASIEGDITIFNLDTMPPIQAHLKQASDLIIGSEHPVTIKQIDKRHGQVIIELSQ